MKTRELTCLIESPATSDRPGATPGKPRELKRAKAARHKTKIEPARAETHEADRPARPGEPEQKDPAAER